MDRIKSLAAEVFATPKEDEIPDLVAKIARLWAEVHEFDNELALELARKLPETQILRKNT